MSENRPLSVAVVGATGAVGAVLLRVLAERRFPVKRLLPLASERSVGSRVAFAGDALRVEALSRRALRGADLVFFAATGALSRQWAPEAVAAGAVVVDKSGSWRMQPDVPLVVPEVNAAALRGAGRGIVSSPNCTTVGVVMALEPLRRAAGLASVVVTTFQAASGAGQAGADELRDQLGAPEGQAPAPQVFVAPLAHNVVPLCETTDDTGESSEERKLREETRKILGIPDLRISTLCTRVPVAVGHAASLLVETRRPLDPAAARRALAAFPGVELVAGDALPTPLGVAGRDAVQVGRVRREPGGDRLWLFEVSDNLRKGAATNAVQIAEALNASGL
jgi:aspartate-semialdehyde dehydrogenase